MRNSQQVQWRIPSNSTGHKLLVKLGWNSLRLHLYACLIKLGIIPVVSTQFEGGSNSIPPVKFDWAWNTGQNGCKFTEITFVCLPNRIGYHPSDFHPIWGVSNSIPPVKFDWAWNTGQNGCKFTEITFVCLPNRIGYHPSDFHPIWLVFHAWLNSAGHEILVKLGVNLMRLHCMPAWSNWVSSLWIYTQFDQYFMPGRIRLGMKYWQNGCKFTEITFVCLPVHSMATWSNLVVIISMDLHPIWLVEFDQAWNTGQIGCKFTEITLYACLVKLGIISVDLHPIWVGGKFYPPSQIWLGINFWSNWV